MLNVKNAVIHSNGLSIRNLGTLVGELEALGDRIDGDEITQILARTHLHSDEVAPLIAPTRESYSRRRVARTDTFELLVMTWLPGQGTGPHDHAGSVSAFKILNGTAHETLFAQAEDSLVDPVATCVLRAGQHGVDAGDSIHAVRNDGASGELLVSVHVYAPPMPEMRRFTMRPEDHAISGAFRRRPAASTPVVAIVGGGFSGTMVAAQMSRMTALSGKPMHVVIVDRQTSIAEGAAYRTPNASHVLNVPASGMSAWPDRPDDLLQWARLRDPTMAPYSFVQRQTYGDYLRATFFQAMAQAGAQASVEIRRDEAASIERHGTHGWRVCCGESAPIEADFVVLATGHRPPVDPLRQRWSGSRARYIPDPWASLALTSIEAHESVCLLGTGLTAIDVLQCLNGAKRSATVVALSRRGLLPAAHAPSPLPPIDPSAWLEPLLMPGRAVTIRSLARSIRGAIRAAQSAGRDWRQVIDGLRPHISRIGTTLPPEEMSRFLRHARAFWEVTRHRMAPAVAETVTAMAANCLFSASAARIVSGHGAVDGVALTVRRRGEAATESLRFDWIVNCTGPGSGRGIDFPPAIAGLIGAGCLEEDVFGLGVRTTPNGRAIADGRILEDLLVVGSLRKADSWESTAVPDLRLQAALAADAIVERMH
jgi:uncharacterized NAD(P)/FAD-binding protein YdhS/predicted metal-dependent enzyme (double-stranded beta helix superfamily)